MTEYNQTLRSKVLVATDGSPHPYESIGDEPVMCPELYHRAFCGPAPPRQVTKGTT